MEPNYNPFEPLPEGRENHQQNYNQPYQQPPRIIRLNLFEAASLVCGIIALVSCTCFYGSYILGALAILFALLSRGGQMKMSSKAKLGLILGIISIILTTVVTVAAFVWAFNEYGSMEGIIQEFCNMYGYDYEEFMKELYQ